MHQYRAQLNRFTTLSSPGSQDLPPGLPAYVNPHIEHQENMSEDIFYISVRRAGHRVLLIILAMLACSQEAVCLLWDYVTPCANLP